MSQYPFIFIGSIFSLLLTNISCNIKDDKNSQDSGFNPNLKRNKREIIDKNNAEISFQYERIPSGTCSTYKINSHLNSINKHLKLIDEGSNFTLDRELQKVCAYKKDSLGHKIPAPIHSKAQLVLEQVSDKILPKLRSHQKLQALLKLWMNSQQKIYIRKIQF